MIFTKGSINCIFLLFSKLSLISFPAIDAQLPFSIKPIFLFLLNKLVSSLSATIVGIAVSAIGLANLPTAETPYAPGMNWVVILLFCVVPMIAWGVTLIVMRKYELTGGEVIEWKYTCKLGNDID